MSNELKQMLLLSPDHHLDKTMIPLIEKWSEPFKAIEVLEVVDYCVHGGLASGFVMSVLETILTKAMSDENTTHEELIKQATWRNT